MENIKKDLIAIVEDEEDISNLIKLHLTKNNFESVIYKNGKDFLNDYIKIKPQLIILDIMLPDIDGFEICKQIRNLTNKSYSYIIMLTAKTDETDKILGLEFGADDYVTKPFSPRELIARVKAILRRDSIINKDNSEERKILNIGNELFIDIEKHTVFDNKNNAIQLTATEFKILKTLAQRPSWVFSREKLINIIWGEERYVIDRTIDVHIKHLREKIGASSRFIKNVRSIGYKLDIND